MKMPKKKRQNFTTFCAEYVKNNNRTQYYFVDTTGTPPKLWVQGVWVYDFANDARDDYAMPKYPKKWTEIKAHLREMNACKKAFVGSWAAYWIWKKGFADSSSFERRKSRA